MKEKERATLFHPPLVSPHRYPATRFSRSLSASSLSRPPQVEIKVYKQKVKHLL